MGVPMQGALVYWVVGNVLLWKMTRARLQTSAVETGPERAAA